MLLAALVGVLSTASIGTAAPAERQYNKPVLTLSVTHIGVGPGGNPFYFMRVDGAGYAEGSTPSGTLTLTCDKGTTCGGGFPLAWTAVAPVGPSGSFISFTLFFNCPSNVKSAIATDTDGVKSNNVKGAC